MSPSLRISPSRAARRRALLTAVVLLGFSAVGLRAQVVHDETDGPRGTGNAAGANAALSLPPSSYDAVNSASSSSMLDENDVSVSGSNAAGGRFFREDVVIRPPDGDVGRTTTSVPWYRSGLVSLALVLLVVGGAAVVARRYFKTDGGSGGETMRTLARTHLSPKQSVVLMQLGRKLVFVGVTPEGMTPLRTVDDPEEEAALRGAQVRARGKRERRFESLLDRETARFSEPADAALETATRDTKRTDGARREVLSLVAKLRAYEETARTRGASGALNGRNAARAPAPRRS